MRRAVSLYTALLALYPRAMREEYGDAMVQLFADRYRDERPGGDIFRFARFWGGMIGDLVWTALTERTESVVSNFKQQWWKWAIGLIALLESVFVVEASAALIFGPGREDRSTVDAVVTLAVASMALAALVVGLRMMRSVPRAAAWLLLIGLLPAIASGLMFFWFPPMYLVSAIAIYLAVRAFMEAGRLTRDPATA